MLIPKEERKRAFVVACGYLSAIWGTPVVVYWALTRAQNWGEFWKVAASPAGTMSAAAGAVLAAYIAILNGDRSRTQERNEADRSHRIAMDRDLRTRFTAASEQLAYERNVVKQAGAYSIAAIADDWLAPPTKMASHSASNQDRQAQVCIDLLCAYLRIAPRLPERSLIQQTDRSATLF